MKANRWLCLFLAICLVFTLAACGGGGGGSDDNNDADTWPVEFYRSTGSSSVSAMRAAPKTGSYKYIYFYENGTYKSGDLNNGTLTQTGSGTYTGGDPHGSVTLSLTGTYEGNTISGKTVVISSSSLTIDGQTFARSDSNTTPDGGGGQSVISGPWLCFTSTGESTISMTDTWPVDTEDISLEYSKNGEPWKDFVIDTTTVNLADGDKVYFRGNNNSFSDNSGDYVKFVMTGPGTIAASGNVMSLVDKTCDSTTIPNNNCFINLFENCSIMTTAPELPAIVLKLACYSGMFMGCTSLTAAPELPAPSLADGCYTAMFYGCSKLTVAPALPSPSLADSCYQGMFQGCSELTTAPELPATNLAKFCYYSMFQGCSKLTTAPELPATNLAEFCYYSMFQGCSKLNYIKVRFTDWNVGGSTYEWVVGVAASGDFYCPKPGDPLGLNIEYGGSYIPTGWDVDDVNNP